MDAATLPLPPSAAAVVEPEDHPGRWVGGLIGAIASIVVAVVASAAGWTLDWFDEGFVFVIGLLGMPVGFILGRAAFPSARADGWRDAVGMGVLIGFAAPPLGAVVLVLGSGALDGVSGFGSCLPPVLLASLLLMYAIPFSFIAVVVTIPAGLLWGVAARAVPDRWLRAARMPAPIARLGVRHAALVATAVLVAVAIAQLATSPACPR
jgi:hypothetical protein